MFGFPVVVHPDQPRTAWFVPGTKDQWRYPVDGALVVSRTRDGGESFEVTDTLATVSVSYTGILPDLFREGQGVVAEGRLEGNPPVFKADTVLAKHDETYMPKDVADRLKDKGVSLGGKEVIK